jgi:archaemetzincin
VRVAAALLSAWCGLAPQAQAAERTVAVIPMGEVDPGLVQVAIGTIELNLQAKARVEKMRELPQDAWTAEHRRWRAEKILEAVGRDLPSGAFKVLVITGVEVSSAKGTIDDRRMGGLGEIGGSLGIVSTWSEQRQAPSTEVLHRRVAELVLHELGHTLGLGHCQTPGCLMREAKARALDSGGSVPARFCDRCRKRLSEAMAPASP